MHVSYIGHATILIDIGQIRILTDPLLRDRLLFLQRHGRNPAPDLLLVRSPDAILISHLHYDHADLLSLRRLQRREKIPVIAPKGSGRYLARWAGVTVHEMAPGDSLRLADVTIHAVPAAHGALKGGSPSLSACLGYVVQNRLSAYFAGDTGLFGGMHEIGQSYNLDLALLPVWGYGHRLGPGHLTPLTAAHALARLRPHVAVPIHWGSLRYPGPRGLWDRVDYMHTPPRAFAEYASRFAPATEVRVLLPGESTALS